MAHGKDTTVDEERTDMSPVEAGFDKFIHIMYYIGCGLIGVAFISVVAEVIFRYFFGLSLVWSMDVTEYCLVTMSCFAFAWVLRKEGHVVLDSLINFLKPRQLALTNTITSIIGAFMCLIIMAAGFYNWWDHLMRGTDIAEKALRPTTALLIWVIPFGFLLLFLQFIRRAGKYWGAFRKSSLKTERYVEDL